MKKKFNYWLVLLAVLIGILICAQLSFADIKGNHPYYLHALTDLRFARANLDKLTPSDYIDNREVQAIAEIDAAIREIKRASIDDGKNLQDHPAIDVHLQKVGRYRKALEVLDKARQDVRFDEDNNFANGLKWRALKHIAEAQRLVREIIRAIR